MNLFKVLLASNDCLFEFVALSCSRSRDASEQHNFVLQSCCILNGDRQYLIEVLLLKYYFEIHYYFHSLYLVSSFSNIRLL